MYARLSIVVLIAFACAIVISSDVTIRKLTRPPAPTKSKTTIIKNPTTASTSTTVSTPTTTATTPNATETTFNTTETTSNTTETASNITVKSPISIATTPTCTETSSNTTEKTHTSTETLPTAAVTPPSTNETTTNITVKPTTTATLPTTTVTPPNTTATTLISTETTPSSTVTAPTPTETTSTSTEATPATTVTPNTTETTTNTAVTTVTPTTTTATTTTTETASTTTPETTTTGCTSTPDVITTTLPPDEIPKFVLIDNGTACIILKANLQLYITYFSDKSSFTKLFTVNDNVKVSGSCKSEEERITLQWLVGPSTKPFNLTIKLVQLPRSPSKLGGSVVRDISFEYFLSSDVFPSTNSTGYKNASVEGSFFETPAAMGFTCSAQQNITMGLVVLGVSHLHLEAFRNSSSVDFNEKALDCMDIPSSNQVVPIIVGVTAAILILLAICAFFIGNRRRAQGYQVL
nr:hypothetical transcript [Hymenolepis microstoma]